MRADRLTDYDAPCSLVPVVAIVTAAWVMAATGEPRWLTYLRIEGFEEPTKKGALGQGLRFGSQSIHNRERGPSEYFVWYFSLMVLGLAFVSACVFSLKKRFPAGLEAQEGRQATSKEVERAVKAMDLCRTMPSTLAVLMMGVEGPGRHPTPTLRKLRSL